MHDKPSRWMIFQRGMEALDEDEQRAVLRELLERGVAADSDGADRLRERLAAGSEVAAAQLAARLQQLSDWEVVRCDWKRTLDSVDGDSAGAIRAARTSLESVCKHICEERGEGYQEGGNLSQFYKATAHVWDPISTLNR